MSLSGLKTWVYRYTKDTCLPNRCLKVCHLFIFLTVKVIQGPSSFIENDSGFVFRPIKSINDSVAL